MKNNVREKILTESLQLFLAKGFSGSTTNELVGLAGVSKGSLYWHFKSKEDILCTILDKYRDEFIEPIIKITDSCNGDFPAKFKTFYKFSTEFGKDNWKLLLVFTTLLLEFAGTDSDIEKRMKELNDRYHFIVEKLLEGGIKDGSVKEGINKGIYARIIVACLMGSLIQWYLHRQSLGNSHEFNKVYASIQRDEILKMVLV